MYFSKVAAIALGLASLVNAAVVDSRQATTDASPGSSASSQCKCGPTDSCWPTATQWARFNTTVGGRLIKTVPIGSVCHTTTIVEQTTINGYNAAQCANVQANWNIPQVSFLECLTDVHVLTIGSSTSCPPAP
jgi:hypothetical protein